MPITNKLIWLVFFLSLMTGCQQEPAPEKTNSEILTDEVADRLIINARVYTLDWPEPALDGTPSKSAPFAKGQWQPDADAVALLDGKILAVGAFEDLQALADESTELLDLNGATLIPGLVDSHAHVAELGEVLTEVNLQEVKTPEMAIAVMQNYAEDIPPGEWIIGQGWDEGAWANNYPDKTSLDNVFPDNPVYLRSLHGFAAWVNSEAMERAGIDKDAEPPVGGEIVRDDSGEPTGILLNRATTMVSEIVPAPSLEKFARYFKKGLEKMAEDGFVAIHEAGSSKAHIDALEYLKQNNALPIRVYAMLSARDEALSKEWAKRGPYIDPDGWLDIRSVKAYYDGALGSRGARLLEDYSDMEGHRGVSGDSYGFDEAIVETMLDAGFQVGIHAIGDAGNREVLSFFAKHYENNPALIDGRHRIEHAQVLHPDDFKHLADLKLIASMEPPHAVEDKLWAEERIGPERIKGAYAWRTMREMNIPLTFNSDLPGSKHDIFYGLHAAVTRRDEQKLPATGWYPEQAVTIEEAIRGYTSWAAFSAFREQDTGVIKPGLWADFTVIDIDPFEVAMDNPGELLNGRILKTIIAGQTVYSADR